jgi:hypothetical protein
MTHQPLPAVEVAFVCNARSLQTNAGCSPW